MITLLPSLTETLVVPLEAEQVRSRLNQAIEGKMFSGRVVDDRFQLTAAMFKPPQFQPVVHGKIESSSRGSLIFLRYELLLSTKISLIFWSVVVTIGSVGAVVSANNFLFMGVGVFMILVARWIVFSNLKLHKDPARKVLLAVLS